jgi:hypothetical protein
MSLPPSIGNGGISWVCHVQPEVGASVRVRWHHRRSVLSRGAERLLTLCSEETIIASTYVAMFAFDPVWSDALETSAALLIALD